MEQRLNARFAEEGSIQAPKLQLQDAQLAALRLKIEVSERKSAMYRKRIERESDASILGALLLLALATVLIVGMFSKIQPTEIITSSFLLNLGYFFGTATSKPKSDDK